MLGVAAMMIEPNCSLGHLRHIRHGKVNNGGLEVLEELGIVCGEKLEGLKFCEDSGYGKDTQLRFSGSSNVPNTLICVYTDLWGSSHKKSGAR